MLKHPVMLKHIALCSLLSVLILFTDSAESAEPSNGRKIADAWCISCHTIPGGNAARDSAPPFELIARNRTFDRDRLVQILSDPHPPMPKIHLSRQQLDDIIAYIHSLRTND